MYTTFPMSTNLKRYIIIDNQILGGTPVIAGTRIPVERIAALVRQGYTTDTLKEEYPHVEATKIQYIISSLMKVGLDEFEKIQKVQATP